MSWPSTEKNMGFCNQSGITPCRLQPHQAALQNMPVMLQWTPRCRSEPSLWPEQIACWTVSRGAWQQSKGSQCWVSLGRPSSQEGGRENWKGPTKVPNTYTYVERVKELCLITLVKEKPQRYLVPAYNYLKGSSLDITTKHLSVVSDSITRKTTAQSSFRD